MISVDEALARILAAVAPLSSETIPLAQGLGRTLAADITANLDNPAFDVSAMDGYAVRAQDVSPGTTLDMIGASQAGADAVIMQEETTAQGNRITFNCDVAPGRSIRFRGEDFSRGQPLVHSGTRLTANQLALIAAGNTARLPVSALPRLARRPQRPVRNRWR